MYRVWWKALVLNEDGSVKEALTEWRSWAYVEDVRVAEELQGRPVVVVRTAVPGEGGRPCTA